MSLRQYFTTHSWWGKLIGAFLGYLIAGPTGALFGILIGNFFDRGLVEHFSRPQWHYHAEKNQTVQKIFFEATFSVIGHVAKSDGRISKEEINLTRTLMQEMGLSAEQRKMAIIFFNEGKQIDFNLKQILNLLKNGTHDNPELLKLFIEIQYRAAQVDGLSDKKKLIMNTILQYLGFAPLHEQYRFYEDFAYRKASGKSSSQGYHQTPKNTLAHAYAILEISQTTNKQEVKRAYRRLMSRNHPDKLIAKGLPEEMIKLANDKTQKIRKAYEQICANKGW